VSHLRFAATLSGERDGLQSELNACDRHSIESESRAPNRQQPRCLNVAVRASCLT
jgi:hypothetical protein